VYCTVPGILTVSLMKSLDLPGPVLKNALKSHPHYLV
jgi:hypothetical protein